MYRKMALYGIEFEKSNGPIIIWQSKPWPIAISETRWNFVSEPRCSRYASRRVSAATLLPSATLASSIFSTCGSMFGFCLAVAAPKKWWPKKRGKLWKSAEKMSHSSLKPRGFQMIYGDLSSRSGYPAKWISTTFQKITRDVALWDSILVPLYWTNGSERIHSSWMIMISRYQVYHQSCSHSCGKRWLNHA